MKHIYIIEDNASLLEGLSFSLEQYYMITTFSDARMALKQLQLEQPDLILLDLLMPDLSGAEFIELFTKQKIQIPIIVMTGINWHEHCNYKAVTSFIRKPFQIKEIKRKIAQIIGD